MPKLHATLHGVDDLRAKFKQLQGATQGAVLRSAVTAGALPIQNTAVGAVPVDTGNLKRSIHTEVTGSKTYAEANIGTDVSYAAYVEFGTKRAAAQPYLRPAFDEQKDRAKNEVGAALKQQLDGI